MGKKGTKRKTQWRTLSITECPPQNLKSALAKQHFTDRNNVNATNTTETNNNEVGAISQDDDCSIHESSYSNPTYLKRKSSTSSTYRNDYRNSSRYSYNSKHNSASSTSSLHSSSRYTAYRRRPFSSLQNGSSRYSSYGSERTYNRGHRSTFSTSNRDTDDPTKKLPFNEEDYTRISTPRQDVIFKKGCFSQPKKYVSSTDTNTTSSAAASIVSAEESVSALSIPSLSPEQCSSVADSLDPDQGFVYSFIDQNGVVYSYVPSGFDQYNGQMMMLPYGYPPYMCSPDVTSPTCSSEENTQTQLPSESEETPLTDLNETKVIDEVPMDASDSTKASSEETLNLQDSNDNKECEENDEKEETVAEATTIEAAAKEDDVTEDQKENKENSDAVQNIPGQFYNYGYPTYYPPPILYPYIVPQQFVPVFGNEFDIPVEEEYNEEIEDQNRIRYRCRKKRKDTEGNSTGVSAATTDYSDEESDQETSVTENEETKTSVEQSDARDVKNLSIQPHETDQKLPALNVDVQEFVPRRVTQSFLNADVQEFLPRTPKDSASDIQFGDVPKGAFLKYNKEFNSKRRMTSRAAEVTITVDTPNIHAQSSEKRSEKKRSELTLAEKIRNNLAAEANIVEKKTGFTQRSLPQRRNGKFPSTANGSNVAMKNNRGRTKVDRVLRENPQRTQRSQETQQSQPSYAQIANHGTIDPKKTGLEEKDMEVNASSSVESKAKVSTEVIDEQKSVLPTVSSSLALSPPERVVIDSWQTVKPRGKRGKYAKESLPEESHKEVGSPVSGPEKESVTEIVTPMISTMPEQPSTAIVPAEKPAPPSVTTPTDTPAEPESVTTPPSTAKKTPKSKNRKNSKKTVDSSAKKKKKIELLEPVFKLPKTAKLTPQKDLEPSFETIVTDSDVENESTEAPEVEDPVETNYTSGESKFSFEQLYLRKGFGRNPMDILKGFDYKYTTKSILKEEEEMVLNVIKSLSNSSSASPPKVVSPLPSIIDDDDCDEKTIEESNKYSVQDSGSEEDTLSELSVVVGESQQKDGIDVRTEEEILAEAEKDRDGSAEKCVCAENAGEEEELGVKDDVFECVIEQTITAIFPNAVESLQGETIVGDEEVSSNDGNNDAATLKSDGSEPFGDKDDEENSDTLSRNQGAESEEDVGSLADSYTLSSQPINLKLLESEDDRQSLLDGKNHHNPLNSSELSNNLTKTEEEAIPAAIQKTDEVSRDESVDPNQIEDLEKSDDLVNAYSQCNGKLSNGIEATKIQDVCQEKFGGKHSKSNFDHQTSNYQNGSFDGSDEEGLLNKLSRSGIHETTMSLGNSASTTVNSQMKINGNVLDELKSVSIPKMNETHKNEDYIACVNGLKSIIRSRESSAEPESSGDSLVEASSLCNGLEESETNVSQLPCLEPIINLNTESSRVGHHNSSSSLPEEDTSTKESTTSLSNTAGESEIAKVMPGIENKIIADSRNTLSNGLQESSTEESNENHAGIASMKFSSCQEIAETRMPKEPHNTTLNSVDKVMNGFRLMTEQCLQSFNNDEKISFRVLNTSISCDHSSGIGSDCEDNQPTSPQTKEGEDKLNIMFSSDSIAQKGENPEAKPLFPVNATASASESTSFIEAKHMPIQVLPIYSQTNSVSCDNQSVSYTSSDSSFDGSVNPGLESTLMSVDQRKDNHLSLDANLKFPSRNENQVNLFPLTEAVKQWLVEKLKEPSPEPLFRVPKDLMAKVLVEQQHKTTFVSEEDTWTSSDESGDENDCADNEYEEDEADYLEKHRTNPKNLKGNPLRVSSCNATNVDSDSDYNSDVNDHHCTGRNDDNTGKRVAPILSDNVLDKNDLLEYWDDEFISNPGKWLKPAKSEHTAGMQETESRDRTLQSPELEPYRSVYGKTIDYEQLKANNYESLSNNILSISKNDANSDKTKSSHNNRAAAEQANQSQPPLGSDKFYNNSAILRNIAATNITSTSASQSKPLQENCMKPPEVCCILM